MNSRTCSRCNLESGRTFWNKQGTRFSRSFAGAPTTNLYLEEEQRLFRKYFLNIKGKKVLKLDLWNEAQNTEILLWAAREGADCYGLDIAETTARKARSRSLNERITMQVIIGDAVSLPFDGNTFDYIYTMGTLEHLPMPEKAFAELARVLKPGGVGIIGVPNIFDPFLFSVASKILQRFQMYPYGYERWYTNRELKCLVENTGLHATHDDGILLLPWFVRFLDLYLWQKFPWACRLTSFMVKPFRFLTSLPWLVRHYGYLTVCVAEK